MKVAVLTALHKLELIERPMPEPGVGEVRVKVAAVGVCGSDVHYYAEGAIGSARVTFPAVLGHEPSGLVDAVGKGVRLAVGTRVAIEPAASCMHCEHCLSGRHNICPNVRFLGTPPYDGIYMEYACVPAHCCIPLPDTVSLVEGALLEPFGVGLHAAKLAHIQPHETVAIFGAGPIGLSTLLAAKLHGAKAVYMTDRIPERVEKALQMGATDARLAQDGSALAWLLEMTGGRGVDVSFEAAGQQETLTQACEATRIGGRAFVIGIPTVPEFTIPMHTCRRKELLLQQVRRSNGEAFLHMDGVGGGRIDLNPLATHLFSLDQIAEAFELVHHYRDGVIRAMILPHGDLDA